MNRIKEFANVRIEGLILLVAVTKINFICSSVTFIISPLVYIQNILYDQKAVTSSYPFYIVSSYING